MALGITLMLRLKYLNNKKVIYLDIFYTYSWSPEEESYTPGTL